MKRLLAQIGITYFSVLAAAYYLPDKTVMIVGVSSLLLSLLFFLIRKIRKTIFIPAMAVAAVMACAFNLGYTFFVVQPLTDRYGGGEHTVQAVLTDEPYQEYAKHYYRLKTVTIDGEKSNCKLLLKTPESLDVEPDDTLTFTSELRVIDNNYYRAKGYYLVSNSFDTVVTAEPASSHSLYYQAIRLRQAMRRVFDDLLPEDCAALCKAVLIGDKYALDADTRNGFRYAGASYFVVVSGMHFSVICLLLFSLLRRTRIHRVVRLVLIFLFMLLYAAVTGFQPSVMRSGIMMALMMIAVTIRWQTYPLNHLGFAGIVIPFIVGPYGAGDIGLILSFYATMSILLWAKPISYKLCFKDEYGAIILFQPRAAIHSGLERCRIHKKNKNEISEWSFDAKLLPKKLWNCFAVLLSVSLAANIFVFPISVFIFHAFSPVTLLSALLLYFEIYLILLLSLAMCVLYWITPLRVVSVPIAWLLYGLCRAVLWIVDTLASLPFSYCRVSDDYFYVWLIVTILLCASALLYRDRDRQLKVAALCSFIILLCGLLTNSILQAQTFSLEVYSCGKGICAGIDHGGKLYLLHLDADSDSVYQLLESLSYRYEGAEAALCCDKDELKNYQRYTQDEFAISSILFYNKNGETVDDDLISFAENSVFVLNDEITVRAAVSGSKVVPYITAGDKHILIVPQNCSIDDIPEDMRRADVIILNSAAAGMENLRCDELIISDTSASAPYTARALKDCYHHVYYTDQGDVTCRLR